ncbi:MAG: (2Fe-2S) ferredoxin domain-containing protein [Leptolyngbyaceae cyanobacterium RM1_406_9]|nr:(2Fe-2S) ferredoxin domain-containing protein [Leptolyngbyaceae cyanobacterium RM1_406_9]
MDLTELLEMSDRHRQQQKPIQIGCCEAAGCLSVNSLAVHQALETAVDEAEMGDRIQVKRVGCLGLCGQGRMVRAAPSGDLYQNVTPTNAAAIVAEVAEQRSLNPDPPVQYADTNHPFFARQLCIVRENSGTIDPEQIEEYIAVGSPHDC